MSDVRYGDNAANNAKTDPIKHVVLLLMENHSFDQMLGSLDAVHKGLDGIKNGQGKINDDGHGKSYRLKETQERQMKLDPQHDHRDVLKQLEGDNGGFVRNFVYHYPRSTQAQRQDIMGYYPLDFLPALHTLGRQFTICDQWFSSLPGPTWPNRFFALSGTSMGEVDMPDGINALEPKWYTEQKQETIFDRLNEKQKSWKVYFYDFPASLLLVNQRKPENLKNYCLFKQFFEDTAGDASAFPEFVLIEPKYFGQAQNDDHPPHNIMKAEKLIADTYNAIRSNPKLWETTLLVVLYDEHGGFFDHVVPPADATPPDEHPSAFPFRQLGVRVPAILVSPWCEPHPCHERFDHCSLLKYLQDKWELGPLGARTANAASIGVAIQSGAMARSGTPPFIRVSNQSLIPKFPELERRTSNPHEQGLHWFADYLFAELDKAGANAMDTVTKLARRNTAWVRMTGALGYALVIVGHWVSKGFFAAKSAREIHTEKAFDRLRESRGLNGLPRD
ncbi:alkaline phosphatase family protein [Trinickia mobilis]|uniref:alkaline phosphatase family protein n=1 Tax=Trinickia mobilis TaxID=2816356 RepID=UPI001A8E66D6|nr:alkaline phosphatase family protein [Trinickia mobilis]